MAQHYGMSGGWSEGDFNYDGVVDFTDLVILGQNYGNSLPAPPSFAEPVGVPEPSAALIGVSCGGSLEPASGDNGDADEFWRNG